MLEAGRERLDVRRQGIVDAALGLADSEGLAAVTMRAVAGRLGIGTMTLYSYVADKDELLELMVDEVSREMLVPEPLPAHWRDALRAIALRTRDAAARHPWMFHAAPRRARRRINTMRHIEQSLAAVAPLEVDDATAIAILMAIDDYTIGHAMRSHLRQKLIREVRAAAARGEASPSIDPAVSDALHSGELPLLAKSFAGRPRRVAPPEGDFERGLEWLLDGIESSVNRP